MENNENKEVLEEVKETSTPEDTSFMGKVKKFFKTIGGWIKRTFFGASKTLYEDDPFAVEKLESPSKMAVKSFFRKKLQVTALIILTALFLFVFIGPKFIPMDVSAETNQKDMAPNMSLRKVPKDLKNNIKTISAFSTFTIGVSEDNEMFIWGAAEKKSANINYKNYPSELEGKGKVAFAAAGLDHCIAITTSGKVVGWGSNSLAQYGRFEGIKEGDESKIFEPDALINGTIDVSNVRQLECGNQCTCIIMNDGSFYMWGNNYATKNIAELLEWQVENAGAEKVVKVAFSNAYAFLLLDTGRVISTAGVKKHLSTDKIKSKVTDIACDGFTVCALLEDGSIQVTGSFEYGQDLVPELEEGEKYVSISGGARHYAAVTSNGVVHMWGSNFYKQTKLDGTKGERVIACSNQTYVLNGDNKLVKSCGLKGFLMGTDAFGRDLFARIVHGGKMTMTIGAVAVIISTIIAIIIGCVSGYFGGWVDMLLMRITEIFSALPFLPFAMMLSVVISNYNIDETTRIFIIMVILGVLSWTGLARMIRGQVLAEREKEFVIAAKAMGVKEGRIAFKHILPNVISIILVSVTLDFAGCMLTESSLSYLGFGVQQPQPTWGNLLNGCNNSNVIKNFWWQWFWPAIFLGVATICVNIIGDGLRDVLDPKSSSER